jgi:hypothetical protein
MVSALSASRQDLRTNDAVFGWTATIPWESMWRIVPICMASLLGAL